MQKVIRSWGYYEVLFESETYKVKRLVIMPGKGISKQSHQFRTEIWNFVSGQCVFRLNDHRVGPRVTGDIVKVRPGDIHEAINMSDEPVIAIETWLGETLLEEDITRYTN